MKIKEIISHLERKYPLYWQESFDNCGVQCGDIEREVTGVAVCFDMSEAVLDDAIAHNANLVISHHPLILRSEIKRITPTDRTGKILCKALENKLVLYSMHTNMDSATYGGNTLFAKKLGLQNCSVLAPKEEMFQKLVVFVPQQNAQKLKEALFAIGCGELGNYSHCSYTMSGFGSFVPEAGAQPFIGEKNREEKVAEERIEMIFPSILQRKVITTIYQNHPYEEPAFDIYKLENRNRHVGLGRVGTLPKPMEKMEFLAYLKEKLNLQVIRYSGHYDGPIERVAVCGGGGSSFISAAMSSGAHAYVTGDIKYHDFFRPENKMILADIGHFEGEHFIREIICNELKENFTNFATFISDKEIREVNYI